VELRKGRGVTSCKGGGKRRSSLDKRRGKSNRLNFMRGLEIAIGQKKGISSIKVVIQFLLRGESSKSQKSKKGRVLASVREGAGVIGDKGKQVEKKIRGMGEKKKDKTSIWTRGGGGFPNIS